MLKMAATGVEIEGHCRLTNNKDNQAGGATQGEDDGMESATARTTFILNA
jgi:hypothetical protein